MKKSRIALLIIIALTFSAFPVSLFVFARAAPTVLPEYEPLDVVPDMGAKNYPIDFNSLVSSSLEAADAVPYEMKDWLTLDDYNGIYFFTTFVLMAQGDSGEVWVQYDLAWPTGDPRDTPVVTEAQCTYLLEQFEDVIIPRDSAYFGAPDYHDGAYSLLEAWGYVPPGYYGDSLGRNVILVANVRDDNYYDPTYPLYIAGFYSSTLEAYFDRNIITIDGYDWENRVGPDGSKPYLYEGTIAHEYQHLIHDDYFTTSALWINEGCSMFAEILCDYPMDVPKINNFFMTPDNSLTEWGEQGGVNLLADYGAAFLFATYLVDNYGENILADYLANGRATGHYGIEGISDVLPAGVMFEEVFHNWRIDNLLRRNYDSLDLYDPAIVPIDPFDWDGEHLGSEFLSVGPNGPVDTPFIYSYGTEYIEFDVKGLNFITFDGDDRAVVPTEPYERWSWNSTTEMWWSGNQDLSNSIIATEVSGSTLTVVTEYEIEPYWDFGFIQVSNTGEWDDWVSLEVPDFTTSDHDEGAHPDVLDNLPGLTGSSEGEKTFTLDISGYSWVGFRYITDWATTESGWFLKDVLVDGTPIEQNLGFVYPPNPEVDFMVTVIEKFDHPHGKTHYKVRDMWICDAYEFGLYLTHINRWEDLILAISPIMDNGYADYSFHVFNFARGKGR